MNKKNYFFNFCFFTNYNEMFINKLIVTRSNNSTTKNLLDLEMVEHAKRTLISGTELMFLFCRCYSAM